MIAMLAEEEAGISVQELYRKYKVSAATYYKLKKKYLEMKSSELKHFKTPKTDNRRLKNTYTPISMNEEALEEQDLEQIDEL